MEQNKKYFVFISYSSLDNEWAIWLRHELEHYHLPASFNGRTDVRDNLRKVFRDRDELSAGPEWDEQVQKALEETNNLIVICSPHSAKSDAVNKEIETFIALGKEDHIFPFIVEGDKPEECFPPALKHSKIGGDVNKDGGRDSAFIKVVAGMLKVSFPSLWNRYEIEKAEEERKIREQRDKLLIMQSRFLAEKANALVEEGDSYTARLLALEALPKDLENPDRPYVPEGEAVLRKCHGLKSIKIQLLGVSSAMFTPNDSFVIATTKEKIVIYNALDGSYIRSLERYSYNNCPASISPNNCLIATPYDLFDNRIFIYTINGEKVRELVGHKRDILFTTFSHDNELIASASIDKTIKIWKVNNGVLLLSLEGHTASVTSVSFSPSKGIIASGSADNTIRLWDLNKGDVITTFRGHSRMINAVVFSPNGNRIASCSLDKTIRIWDIKNKQEPLIIKDSNEINSISFSPDGNYLVSASWGHSVKLWDSHNGKELSLKMNLNSQVFSAFFSSDGKQVITSSSDCIQIWDVFHSREFKRVTDVNKGARFVSFSPRGEFFVVAMDKEIKVLNRNNSYCLFLGKHKKKITSLFYNHDGKYILSTSLDGTIKVWDAIIGGLIVSIDLYEEVYYASFSQDGKMIISASESGCYIWNTEDGNCITRLSHSISISAFFSNNDKYVFFTENHSLFLKNIKDNSLIMNYYTNDEISFASLSPDGKYVVFAHNKSIEIYSLQTQEVIKSFNGHLDRISTVYFSPNGKYIISSSWDSTVRIWDIQNLIEIDSYTTSGIVNIAKFDQTGEFIAASCWDTYLWQFPTLQNLIKSEYERFKNNPLSPEERKKYYLD